MIKPFTVEWNLSIRNVTYSDEGQYHCEVNTVPVTSRTVNRYVLVPAKIINSSNNTLRLREGETLVLECNVTGIPPPSVSWYKLNEGSKYYINHTGEALIIPNVTRLHAGTYQCVAYNGVLDVSSMEINVFIHFIPEVTLPTKRIGQKIGKETILDCVIDASPLPQVKWLKGNVSIRHSYKYRTEIYRNPGDVTSITLSLRIIYLQRDDFGNYTCYARNYIGEDFDSMMVYDYAKRFTTTKAPATTRLKTPATTRTKTPATTRTKQQTDLSNVTVSVLKPDVSRGKHHTLTSSFLVSVITIQLMILRLFYYC